MIPTAVIEADTSQIPITI
ncbi:hypothetical protein D018_0070, partial [Vibrio parahaemolyticus VP2007-007]